MYPKLSKRYKIEFVTEIPYQLNLFDIKQKIQNQNIKKYRTNSTFNSYLDQPLWKNDSIKIMSIMFF